MGHRLLTGGSLVAQKWRGGRRDTEDEGEAEQRTRSAISSPASAPYVRDESEKARRERG